MSNAAILSVHLFQALHDHIYIIFLAHSVLGCVFFPSGNTIVVNIFGNIGKHLLPHSAVHEAALRSEKSKSNERLQLFALIGCG